MYPATDLKPTADTVIVDRKNAPQTTVVMGLPVLTPKEKDYLPQVVANSLLGGSFGSRITSNIRENKGYTYSPISSISLNRGGAIWQEVADVTSKHTIDAVQEIDKEIKRLQNEPPKSEELDGIKNYMAGTFVLRNSTPSGIIAQLNFLGQYGLPDTYLTNYVKNVHAVSPEKISEIIKNTLIPGKMLRVMVGDKDAIEKQIGAAKKGF